jgi:hypothetical protein
MSDEPVTHAPAEHGTPNLPFSEAEIAEFRQSDIAGGGSIVVLMAAIFTIGLVLYGIIAIVTNLTLYGFDP